MLNLWEVTNASYFTITYVCSDNYEYDNIDN